MKLKAEIWKDEHWNKVIIVSINIIPKIELIDNEIVTDYETHIFYYDDHNTELQTIIINDLTDIKLI